MIRLIQRRLIIPRGDTGAFNVPVLSNLNTGDVAIFTILDSTTNTKIFTKKISEFDDVLKISFSHSDTVNLPVGKYYWDIKFYKNPVFMNDELVDGEEVDSYYAAFTLPVCEIRQTGDQLLTSDGSPNTTLTAGSINILNAAIAEVTSLSNSAANSIDTIQNKAAEIIEIKSTIEEMVDTLQETLQQIESQNIKYELIKEETFINESEADFIITTDLNDNFFELTDIILLFETPIQNSYAKKGDFGRIYFYLSNSEQYYITESEAWEQLENEESHGCFSKLEQKDGLMFISATNSITNLNTDNFKFKYQNNFSGPNQSIFKPADKLIFNKIIIKSVTGTGHYLLFGKRK